MDVSPLPHKPVFSFARKLEVQTAIAAVFPPADEDMISPCDASAVPLVELSRNQQLPESVPRLSSARHRSLIARRRKHFARPSLSRTKCFSAIAAPRSADSALPSFRFGAGGNGLSLGTSITSLNECFHDSPPQDRVSISAFGPPRPRQLFAHNALSRKNSSPCNNHVKKQVEPIRPRKLFRRSLSMFEHPGDVMEQRPKPFQPSALQSVTDIDEVDNPLLPHFVPTDAPCSLPRINQDTLVDIINGKYNGTYDNYMLIDCRFEYEFNGGHIEGAENYNDKDTLARALFDTAPSSKTLLIFHCEYSQQRAPLMAQHIRKHDRAYNAAQYPKLTFPEVYILDGGYSAFFKVHRSRCFPPHYVEMEDEKHEQAMERGLGKMKQRKPLQRSQTYAFGQNSCQAQDSPSRQPDDNSNGNNSSLFSSMDLDQLVRLPTRRMVSY